jgi:hypothetical protein
MEREPRAALISFRLPWAIIFRPFRAFNSAFVKLRRDMTALRLGGLVLMEFAPIRAIRVKTVTHRTRSPRWCGGGV